MSTKEAVKSLQEFVSIPITELVKSSSKPQFGSEELRMVAQFVLRSLSHRLAKRHGLQNLKDAHDWQMAEKARTLYQPAN